MSEYTYKHEISAKDYNDLRVGAVKFDFHPAFDWKSGDDMFQ